MHDTDAPLSFPPQALVALLDAVAEGPMAVLDAGHRVCAQNTAFKDRSAWCGSPDAWLRDQPLHDPVSRAALASDQTILSVAQENPSGLAVGYLTPAGGEYVTVFRHVTLPGTTYRLLVGRDLRPSTGLASGQSDAFDAAFHDLGNVLGVIELASDRLGRGTFPDDGQTTVHDIRTSIERGHRVMHKLWHSGATEDPPDGAYTDFAHIDFAQVTRAAASVFARVLPPTLRLQITAPDTVPIIGPGAPDCEAVVIEMLGAARKALAQVHPPSGRIALEVGAQGAMVTLSVTAHREGDVPVAHSVAECPAARDLASRFGGAFVRQSQAGGVVLKLSLPIARPVPPQIADQEDQPLTGYVLCVLRAGDALSSQTRTALHASGAAVYEVETVAELETLTAQGIRPDVVLAPANLEPDRTVERLAMQDGSVAPYRLILSGGVVRIAALLPRAPFAVLLERPVSLATLVNAVRLRPAHLRDPVL